MSMTFTVAADRFILVAYPRSRYKITMKRAHVITTTCWLLAVTLAMSVGLLPSQGAAALSEPFHIHGQLCMMELSTNTFVYIVAYLELFSGFGLHIASTI